MARDGIKVSDEGYIYELGIIGDYDGISKK